MEKILDETGGDITGNITWNAERVNNADANDYIKSGNWYFGTGCTNVPQGYTRILTLGNESSADTAQIGIGISGNKVYTRTRNSNVWGNWQSLLPETVTNSNGTATKFPDGTMVCRRKIQKSIPCNSTWGTLYHGEDSTEYAFAETFTEIPNVQVSVRTTTSTSCWQINYNTPVITKSTYKWISIMRPTSSDNVPVEIDILAIGKWK